MPITEQNYQKAEDLLARESMNPNADQSKLAELRSNLASFYQSRQPSGAVAPPPEPQRPNTSVGGYFQEPSVDAFRADIAKPEVQERLGLLITNAPGTASVAGDYLASKVPELRGVTDVSRITPSVARELDVNSPEYKAYSEDLWKSAHEKDPSLKRYKDVSFAQNPFDATLGGVLKYAPALASGVNKTLNPGNQETPGESAVSGVNRLASRLGLPATGDYRDPENAVNRSFEVAENTVPGAVEAGQMTAYALPFAPANAGTNAALEATNFAARGKLAKLALGTGIGSIGSGGEGMAQYSGEHPEASLSENFQANLPNFGVGALAGFGGQIIAELGSGFRQRIKESPRYQDLHTLRNAGGDTAVLAGVKAPESIRANIRSAVGSGEHRQAVDFAADKVAPQIQQSIETQTRNTHQKIAKDVQDYTNHPTYGQINESFRPLTDSILEMSQKGMLKNPVTGEMVPADPASAKIISDIFHQTNTVQYVKPEQVESFASQHGAVPLNPSHQSALGVKPKSGWVPMAVPHAGNAEAVMAMEDMIDRNLKMATTPGGVNNPTWREINKQVKGVRDRFPYPESGNLDEVPKAPTPPPAQSNSWQELPSPQAELSMRGESGIKTGADTGASAPAQPISSVGSVPTEIPKPGSGLAPVADAMTQSRYHDPSASEYARMQNGEFVDKSANGYQRLIDVEDYAPGYRLRANPNEISSLTQLANEADELEAVYRANPGISPEEAQRVVAAKQSLPSNTNDYQPEFPASESERQGWASPYYREQGQKTPFDSIHPNRSEWSPNQDLYTANPPENISAESYQSIAPESTQPPSSPHPSQLPKNQKQNKSLFPEVEDQKGVPSRTDLAAKYPEPEVGKVKEIIAKTDDIASQLSPAELDAIHSYTQRKGDKVGSPEWESATKKLTIDNPTEAGALYHGTRLPQEKIDEILKSKKFSMDKPTSTSYNRGVASSMAYSRAGRGEPVIFHVDGVDNGISLTSKKLGIAGSSNEREILLHKKEFEVTGSHKDPEGNLVIELKQTAKASQSAPEIQAQLEQLSKIANDPRRLKQLTATLDDGTVVTGLSALRRKQHLAQQALEEVTQATGANSLPNITKKVQAFGQRPGNAEQDKALLEEARKLGLEKELREVGGTNAYRKLRERAQFASGEGALNAVKDALALRLDAALGVLSGAEKNPFATDPVKGELFRSAIRDLLNLSGGRAGARYGNELRKNYVDLRGTNLDDEKNNR